MQETTKSRNELIQLMRGFGALTVYIWHMHNHYLDYIFKGYLANTFFFFIAAYFIGKSTFSMSDSIAEFDTFSFLKKRLYRIYPLYLLTTLAMAAYAIVRGGELDSLIFKKLVPHLLLIRSWIPCYPYDTGGADALGLNGPGWFLSAMFLYWLLTKPMLKLIWYVGKRKWSVLFIIICCAVILGFGFIPAAYSDLIPNAFKPQHIFLYLLGLYSGYNGQIGKTYKLSGITVVLYTVVVLVASNINIPSENFAQVLGDTLFALELMYVIPLILKIVGHEQKGILFTFF